MKKCALIPFIIENDEPLYCLKNNNGFFYLCNTSIDSSTSSLETILNFAITDLKYNHMRDITLKKLIYNDIEHIYYAHIILKDKIKSKDIIWLKGSELNNVTGYGSAYIQKIHEYISTKALPNAIKQLEDYLIFNE